MGWERGKERLQLRSRVRTETNGRAARFGPQWAPFPTSFLSGR